MLLRALLLFDDDALEARLERVLSRLDIVVTVPRKRARFWEVAKREPADFVLADSSRLPVPASTSVASLRQLPDRPEVVVFVGDADPTRDAELLAGGALAVLHASLSDESLAEALGTLLRRGRDEEERRDPRGHLIAQPRLSDFLSRSPNMQEFLDVVGRVVHTDSALLLLGETGVGKERLSRAIHHEGSRASGPFVAVNCGAFPEALLESELFGHEEGAFTGATRARRGFFELAHRGTIFLDEVGEMPLHLQVRLLRVLQEYEIQRVGGERTIPIDVRVVAATNVDLEELVAAKRFRRDLYYRLAVVTLTVPPLRERRDDVPALVDAAVKEHARRLGREVDGVTEAAMRALQRYDWPGNVRELLNVIERAVLLCRGRTLDVGDLPLVVTGRVASGNGSRPIVAVPDEELFGQPWTEARRRVLSDFERLYLEHLLTRTEGRIGRTAELAGLQPRSLFEKMRQHGLRKEDFRVG